MATNNEISHRSGSRKNRGATIGSTAPNQRWISLLALGLLIAGYAALFSASLSRAAEPDLKPGDTIGPQNWERVKGMVEKTCSIASNEATVSKSKTIAASARPVNLSPLPLNTPAKSSWDFRVSYSTMPPANRFPTSIRVIRKRD